MEKSAWKNSNSNHFPLNELPLKHVCAPRLYLKTTSRNTITFFGGGVGGADKNNFSIILKSWQVKRLVNTPWLSCFCYTAEAANTSWLRSTDRSLRSPTSAQDLKLHRIFPAPHSTPHGNYLGSCSLTNKIGLGQLPVWKSSQCQHVHFSTQDFH